MENAPYIDDLPCGVFATKDGLIEENQRLRKECDRWESRAHKEAMRGVELDQLRDFLSVWISDGALQTFENREKFRREARALLTPNADVTDLAPEGDKS